MSLCVYLSAHPQRERKRKEGGEREREREADRQTEGNSERNIQRDRESIKLENLFNDCGWSHSILFNNEVSLNC